MNAPAPRIAHATALRDQLKAILNAADLAAVTVTLDARDIPSGSRAGVVVLTPPDMTFPTFHHTDVTQELAAIAGPADNLLAAWTRLDQIIEALRAAGVDLAEARADMFAVKDAAPLPGYAITLNPETVIEESETP